MTSSLGNSFKILLLSASVSLTLTACGSSQPDRMARIDSVLQNAANEAVSEGRLKESIGILEKMYKRDSSNPDLALRYARGLRYLDHHQRAALVLKPFVDDQNSEIPDIFLEYASLQTEMGHYQTAEKYARDAVLLTPETGKPYHILGIALDAQGYHEQAEAAFDKAIERWEGNPAPVLNNLGLNLASQGFLDQAVETLRSAFAIAPDRREIERNLRIVMALQSKPYEIKGKAPLAVAPKPLHKPTQNHAAGHEQAHADEEMEKDRETETKPASGPFSEKPSVESSEAVKVEVEDVEKSKMKADTPEKRDRPSYN